MAESQGSAELATLPVAPTSRSNGRMLEAARAYQRALESDPADAQALIGMSVLALASGQAEHASRLATVAVGANGRNAAGWIVLGHAHQVRGKFADAENAFCKALELDGANALARLGLGEVRLATGRHSEAIRDFELVLRGKPTLACAHLGIGNALAAQGDFDGAFGHYKVALSLRPRYAEAEFAAGFALCRLGRAREGETRYRRAIALRPGYAAAWINLGSLLRELARDFQAEAALKRAVELRPDLISGWLNLAALERERKRFAPARVYLTRALTLDASQIETLLAWCQLELAAQDFAGAHEFARWALAIDPNHAEALNQLGIVLHNQRRFAEAIAVFERAEVRGSKGAASNRGNSLLDLGSIAEALETHRRAARLDPDNAGAQYNLALTELRLGNWRSGWQNYEARWRFREVHRVARKFRCRRWHGEPLEGRRILLHAEQGLGDTIQFSRYASLVAARGGFPILAVQPAVERLLGSLAVVRAGLAEVRLLGEFGNDFDLECPLMSLPAVFATTTETVPWSGAYLGVADNKTQVGSAQTARRDAGLRVGIAWAGNPKYRADSDRSMQLKTLEPLLSSGGIDWISLQKGEAAGQLAALPRGISVTDGSSCDRDLADTAALIATLDLVITTDTSIAHLAGAMGKPVWIMLPYLADWRWMQKIEMTPWYPTARLFRQAKRGDWASVLERVGAALKLASN